MTFQPRWSVAEAATRSLQVERCMDVLGWSSRFLAGLLDVDDRTVRRWAYSDPRHQPEPEVLDWLMLLARFHEANPPPVVRRTPAPDPP